MGGYLSIFSLAFPYLEELDRLDHFMIMVALQLRFLMQPTDLCGYASFDAFPVAPGPFSVDMNIYT